jgi:hypothetical protein
VRHTPLELAIHDAHPGFPAAADTFYCALGLPVTETDTPGRDCAAEAEGMADGG